MTFGNLSAIHFFFACGPYASYARGGWYTLPVFDPVMQALVRIQAYMLADIVVAIPAVDLAIEAVV